jgi:CheY-like chemotaxis protein
VTPSVLVVDGEPDTAASLAALLELYGFAVRTAPDGPSALAAAVTDRPDAVLTELRLPGMSGLELARKLREQFPDRPPFVVAVTGAGQPKDRQRSADAGIDLHLVKPADPAAIVASLDRLRAGTPSQI